MNAAVGEEPTPPAPESLTPGEMLRRERERRGLSVQHAAEELHLDAWTIEALEADRFAALGAPVYAKGYLRKYALTLGLSPETVIGRYERLSDVPPTPTPIPKPPAKIERISLGKPLLILAGVILAALVIWLAVYLLSPSDDAPPPSADVESQAEPTPDASAASVAVETPETPTATSSVPPASAGTAIGAGSASPTAPAATPSAAPAGPQVRLRLEFTDTSWTEIYDATGRRLMFGLGEAGRVRTVAGAAPLRVTLGAASAVNAQVNDQPIVIPRRAGRDASKFVVEADGRVSLGGASTTMEQ